MGVGTPFKLSVETSGASQRADDSPALRASPRLGSGKVRFTNRLVPRDIGMALEGME